MVLSNSYLAFGGFDEFGGVEAYAVFEYQIHLFNVLDVCGWVSMNDD